MIIHLLRKPLVGTVAENAIAYGAGAMNINGSRIGKDGPFDGRWPANLLHDGTRETIDRFPEVGGGSWNRTDGARTFFNNGEPTRHTSLGTDDSFGSAARFFQAFDWGYLMNLIKPPEPCVCLTVENPLDFSWSSFQESSIHAMIVTRGLSGSWIDAALKAMKPGGHVLIASADDVDPTNSDVICAAEEAGFEVRDSFFVVSSQSKFEYTSKASVAEKEAGTYAVKAEDDPRGNKHLTVKPLSIMQWCVADFPHKSVVLDPFLGSGTTGIACLNQGLDFIGIEISKEYLGTADARVRHWNHDRSIIEGRAAVDSECDTTPKQIEEDFDGFFGL